MMEEQASLVEKLQCTYTHCYCEENVWKLCELISHQENSKIDQCFAVFLSSDDEALPMFFQQDDGGLIIWDYHVIMILKEEKESIVYDLDTRLPFPISFMDYIYNSFLVLHTINPKPTRVLNLLKKAKFRIVPAREYLQTFSSDRSHMLDPKDPSRYLATPPTYPLIQSNPNTTMNLNEFRKMNLGKLEQVVDMDGLCEFFAQDEN